LGISPAVNDQLADAVREIDSLSLTTGVHVSADIMSPRSDGITYLGCWWTSNPPCLWVSCRIIFRNWLADFYRNL